MTVGLRSPAVVTLNHYDANDQPHQIKRQLLRFGIYNLLIFCCVRTRTRESCAMIGQALSGRTDPRGQLLYI